MEPDVIRAIERIIGVMIGGLSVYLGYRLFLHLPDKTDSDGKIILPGNISIYLSRVGPGAFFALFGTLVVAASFYYGIVYKSDGKEYYHGVALNPTSQTISPKSTEIEGNKGNTKNAARLRGTIRELNRLYHELIAKEPSKRLDHSTRFTLLKLPIMAAIWDPQWGFFEVFKEWAENPNQGELPDSMLEAKQIFNFGL